MKSIVLPFLLALTILLFTTVSDSPRQKNSLNKPTFPVLDLCLLGETRGMNALAEKAVLIQGDSFINQYFKDQDLSVFVGSDIANPFSHPEWYSFSMLGIVSLNEKVDSYLILMSSNNKEEDDSYFYLVSEVKGKVTSIINIAILSKKVFVGCQVNRDDEGYYLIIRRGSLLISDMVYPYDEDFFEPDIYSKVRLLANGTIHGSVIPSPGGKATYAHKDFNDYYKIELRIKDYQTITIRDKTVLVCNINNNTSKSLHITDLSSSELTLYSNGKWLDAKVDNVGTYSVINIEPGKSASVTLLFVIKEIKEANDYKMRLTIPIPEIGIKRSNLVSLTLSEKK